MSHGGVGTSRFISRLFAHAFGTAVEEPGLIFAPAVVGLGNDRLAAGGARRGERSHALLGQMTPAGSRDRNFRLNAWLDLQKESLDRAAPQATSPRICKVDRNADQPGLDSRAGCIFERDPIDQCDARAERAACPPTARPRRPRPISLECAERVLVTLAGQRARPCQ